jgi:hypothetical protein
METNKTQALARQAVRREQSECLGSEDWFYVAPRRGMPFLVSGTDEVAARRNHSTP